MSPRVRRLPLVTLFLVAGGAALSFLPEARAALAFARDELARGGWWRLLTAHLVHVSRELALADLGALLVFGAVQELRSRVRWAIALATATLLTAPVLLAADELERYSGCSALVAAAVAAGGVDLLLAEERRKRWAGALVLGGYALKCALELRGCPVPLAAPLPRGVVVVGGAHAAGALAGALAALVWRIEPSDGARRSDGVGRRLAELAADEA